MSDNRPPQSAPPQVTIRSPEHKIVYSDVFTIKVSSVDFTMTFGVNSQMPVFNQTSGMTSNINAIIEQFSVAMPLPTFKSVAEHMAKVVEIIESEIGYIRTPAAARLTPEHEEMIRNNLRINPLV